MKEGKEMAYTYSRAQVVHFIGSFVVSIWHVFMPGELPFMNRYSIADTYTILFHEYERDTYIYVNIL